MLLGLDIGTTNVKAAVTDQAGHLLGQGSVPVPLFHLENGGVEQDLEQLWAAVLEAAQEALRSASPARIRAIGISSQGGALQLLNPDGKPLGRVISWLDSRGSADDDQLTRELGRAWFRKRIFHGRSNLALGQLLRLRREQPGLLEPPRRIGFVGDVILRRLCGRQAHDGTSCALTLLYNPARRDYDPDVLRCLGLQSSQLPELVTPPAAAGALLPDIARQLGLPAGIPVSPAIHDQYAAALGSGAVHPGDILFGAGTAWVLLAILDRLADPVTDHALVCHHVVDGLFGQIISLRNGGSAFQWGLKLLGWDQMSPAQIDQQLQSVPPGSAGLRCRPLFGAFQAAGVPAGATAALDGLQLAHTPAHLLRGILEGLAFELNRHLQFLRKAGMPIRRLIMTGAAAASEVTPQMISDVTGLPLACLGATEGSVRGAVVLARGLLPGQGSLRELAQEMAPKPRELTPGPNADCYRQLFAKYLESFPTPK